MTDQKDRLVQKVIDDYGIKQLFIELGLERVTQDGENIYSTCPFHPEADNPTAFAWTNSKKFAYCFSRCRKSYDLFDIVMHTKGLDFVGAMEFLASLVHFDLNYSYTPKTSNGADNRAFLSQARKAKKIDLNIITEPFDPKILQSFEPRLHTTMRREGFDEETREYFGLGFATDGYLSGRITIPIDDIDGNIITVSGRSTMSDVDIDFTGEKKYKIWYGTDKGKTLYNISRALPYIQLLGEVIVVEGFKSCFRLHQWGIDNVVATMGSTLTEEQKVLLLKLGCKIISVGDKDLAGQGLNKQVMNELGKFTDTSYMDLFMLNIPDTSSPAELKQLEWEYLYKHRKYKI